MSLLFHKTVEPHTFLCIESTYLRDLCVQHLGMHPIKRPWRWNWSNDMYDIIDSDDYFEGFEEEVYKRQLELLPSKENDEQDRFVDAPLLLYALVKKGVLTKDIYLIHSWW